MAIDPKIASLVGFAAKSGNLLLGTYAVERGIKEKRAKMVLTAEDLSPKRLNILKLWCSDMDIPLVSAGSKEDYGELLKKPPLGLMAITDEHMALGISRARETNGGCVNAGITSV